MNKLEMIQRHAARYVLHRHNTSSVTSMLQTLDWTTVQTEEKAPNYAWCTG